MDFLQTSVEKDRASLGRLLMSWIFAPRKSNRFVLYLLGLIGALFVFTLLYGSHFLPWLERVPDALIYVLFLAAGPLLNLFRSLGKTQEWTLYERGFSVKYINRGKGTGDERFYSWHHYKSCAYDSKVVTLFPVQRLARKIKMRTDMNGMAIYTICRERISIAQADALHHATRQASTPNTPEQRRLARLDKQYSNRVEKGSLDWKDLFKG
ncbi:hypothetical protein JW998_07225 [candidate division KSB1 bacterium]|nr:hypothetical protein [candidate division KSB1 bacterium]